MAEKNEMFLLELEMYMNHERDKEKAPNWIATKCLVNVFHITSVRKSFVIDETTEIFTGGSGLYIKGNYEDIKKKIASAQKNAIIGLKKDIE